MDARATVVAVRDVGPDTVAIEFETPRGFDAEPGQFVRLSATVDGETYRRFYTLSSPDVAGTFEVTVGVAPDEAGPFSRRLADLAPDDELDLAGPFGDSYYDGEARAVVLAGGPGVGPAVAIAERALDDGNEAAVVYVPAHDEPSHVDRLDAIRERGAPVHVVPQGDPIGAVVADALGNGDGDGDSAPAVFVYGFSPFVDAARGALEAAGFDPADAKVEDFG